MLPLLFYNQLDSHHVQKTYKKVLNQLAEGDFKSADVRKMTNAGYYRAKLNIKDRLLFTFALYKEKKILTAPGSDTTPRLCKIKISTWSTTAG